MKYKFMDEWMSHKISHLFIKPCVKCVFNAWNIQIMNEQILHDFHY